MTSKNYSSADFDKTPAKLKTQIPSKLIHKNVENSERESYSNERKHPVFFVDLPSKTINMTIGGLVKAGKSNKHRHSYETILYVIEGEGYSIIENEKIDWQAGDAVYIPVWAWHQHINLSQDQEVKYIAYENAALLQNIGELAIREES